MVLGDGGLDVLDKLAVAVFAKLDRRTLQAASHRFDGVSQSPMRFHAAGDPRDSIDDNDWLMTLVFAELDEHGFDARPVGDPTGNTGILENCSHLVAFVSSEFAATGFLARQPVALFHLRLAGDAGVDDCEGHDVSFLC